MIKNLKNVGGALVFRGFYLLYCLLMTQKNGILLILMYEKKLMVFVPLNDGVFALRDIEQFF